MIGLGLIAAQVMAVPAVSGPALPPLAGPYSIVIARAVEQKDPIPIDCGSEFCTSWFLGRFDRARPITGDRLPSEFDARIEMGSPFISKYELALLVETLGDGSRRVRAAAGFHDRTKLACFDAADTAALTPPPAGEGIVQSGKNICVK